MQQKPLVMKLIFATGNSNKVIEAQKAIGNSATLIMPKDLCITEEIPEHGNTLEANAEEKCRYIWNRLHTPCFADDTGLEVEALDGAPGVYTARYAGETKSTSDNMDKLLNELMVKEQEGNNNRKARFRTVIALIINGELHTFQGILNGTIARKMSGKAGFGYDPVFIPEGYDITLAELTLDQKNAISHRGKVMRLLKEYLYRCNAE